MTYSKRITELQTLYQLSPMDVMFCMLVACGADRAEAYNAIFRPNTAKKENMKYQASQLAREKPGIENLIKSMFLNYGVPVGADFGDGEDKSAFEPKRYRDKDSILTALEQEVQTAKGKERADILLRIADLQRMKQEENKEEEKRIHYYLPIKCSLCQLYTDWLAEKNNNKEE